MKSAAFDRRWVGRAVLAFGSNMSCSTVF